MFGLAIVWTAPTMKISMSSVSRLAFFEETSSFLLFSLWSSGFKGETDDNFDDSGVDISGCKLRRSAIGLPLAVDSLWMRGRKNNREKKPATHSSFFAAHRRINSNARWRVEWT